jgi:ABC-2 type transport system ATP-binding protein
MRQRLAVARSLLPDPHVILMDEPAAGLDPAGRVQFRQLLASLRDQGRALIISSHILADLAEYCTHIGIMAHGRLVRFGTVSEVTGEHSTAHSRFRVQLADRIGDLEARVRGFAGVESCQVSADGRALEILHPAEPSSAAALLRALVTSGLPVTDFRKLDADLEQAYLRAGIRQVD